MESTKSQSLVALSTLAFKGIGLPPRTPSSAVITILHLLSRIRSRKASGEKPPNTTEWIAPTLAHASIAIAASKIIGIYKHTRSPFITPNSFKPFENLQTFS